MKNSKMSPERFEEIESVLKDWSFRTIRPGGPTQMLFNSAKDLFNEVERLQEVEKKLLDRLKPAYEVADDLKWALSLLDNEWWCGCLELAEKRTQRLAETKERLMSFREAESKDTAMIKPIVNYVVAPDDECHENGGCREGAV